MSNKTLTVSDFYAYTPSIPLTISAIVVFGVISAVLIFEFFAGKFLWKPRAGATLVESQPAYATFMLWMILFTLSEMGGYIAFLVFLGTPLLSSYLAELIILILAPNLVGLTIYTVGSRILAHANFHKSSSSFERLADRLARFVPLMWFSVDLLALVLQGIGGSFLSSSQTNGAFDQSAFDTGKTLTLAGLSVQFAIQICFIVFTVWIYFRMADKELKSQLRWTWLNMWLVMAFLLVRNVYRLAEFGGNNRPPINDTPYAYGFMDLLMMVCIGITCCVLDLGRDAIFPFRVRKVSAFDVMRHHRQVESEMPQELQQVTPL